jgi:hypothetical protein
MKKFLSIGLIEISFIFSGFSSPNLDTTVDYSSRCVQNARNATLQLAELKGEDANGDNFDYYMEIYMIIYTECLR